MQCELCGKETQLFNAIVEGIELRVCTTCGKHGRVLNRVKPVQAVSRQIKKVEEPVEEVVNDYSQRIRNAREKRGLSQQDFAKHIMVKESLVSKIETGHYEPPLDLARKLEKILGITLVEIGEESSAASYKQEKRPSGLTIGDILNLKR